MYITDTGTGKTIIALFHYLKYMRGKFLRVVAPASKVKEKGWEREIDRVSKQFNIKIDYIVQSYDKFSRELKLYCTPDLIKSKYKNEFVIFDEGHYIKNRTSQRTKNIKKYIKITGNDFILLTATPTPNGYIDYGSYLEMFKKVPNAYMFEKKYGMYDEKLMRYDIPKIVDWNNKPEIDSMFYSVSSKPLKKEDCLDLPAIVYKNLYFTPSKEYKEIDKTLVELPATSEVVMVDDPILKEKLNEKLEKKNIQYIEKKNVFIDNKLSKVKDERERVFYETLRNNLNKRQKLVSMLREYSNPIDKVAYLQEFLENTDNNTVIFYNFRSEYELLYKMIKELENKKTIYTINGDLFNKPDNKDIANKNVVTLVQLQAGSAGIELQYSDIVVMFSPTYTYQDWYQALGRAYRIGQKNKVTVYSLIVQDSFEENIQEKLRNKENFDLTNVIMREIQERKRKKNV